MRQLSSLSENFIEIAVWGTALIVLFIALWIVWICLRKWYAGLDQHSRSKLSWTLQDLRDMKERGDISETEFQTLRQQTISTLEEMDSGPTSNS